MERVGRRRKGEFGFEMTMSEWNLTSEDCLPFSRESLRLANLPQNKKWGKELLLTTMYKS